MAREAACSSNAESTQLTEHAELTEKRPGVHVLDARRRRHEELQLDSETDEAVCDQLEEYFPIGPAEARYRLVELELALLNPGSLDWARLRNRVRRHASYDKYELEDIATVLKMIPIVDSLPPLIVHHRADIDEWGIIDGFHRAAAHNECGHECVVCYELVNRLP